MDEQARRRLVAAGAFDPDAPGAADRAELLDHLLDHGVGVDEVVVAWHGRGVIGLVEDLLGALVGTPEPLVQRFLGPTLLTPVEVAERAGVAVELVQELRRVLDVPPVAFDEAGLPSTFVEDVGAFALGVAVFGEERVLALSRVVGSTAARLAEATQAMVFVDLAPDLLAEPGGELRVLLANAEATSILPVIPDVWRRAFFEHVSVAGRRMRPGGLDRPAVEDLQVAVAFVDLVASTEWARSVSLEQHRQALVRFEVAAADLANAFGGRVVKAIGDEVMVSAYDPVAACRIAHRLCATLHDDPDLPEARAGVAFGSVTARDGDVFGPNVNLAARAAKVGAAGQVVVTAPVRDRLGPWPTDPLGPVDLRGIGDPVPLWTLGPEPPDPT